MQYHFWDHQFQMDKIDYCNPGSRNSNYNNKCFQLLNLEKAAILLFVRKQIERDKRWDDGDERVVRVWYIEVGKREEVGGKTSLPQIL